MKELSTYKGIDYIRLKQLPLEEQNQIKNWLTKGVVIKIQNESELMADCILYRDYVDWYKKFYSASEELKHSIQNKRPVKKKKSKIIPELTTVKH